MQNELNNLIMAFVELPSEEKPFEIINTIKENIAVLQDLCIKFEIDNNILVNREMVDINKEYATNDDYYEAIYAYIKSFENINGSLLNGLSNIIYGYICNGVHKEERM